MRHNRGSATSSSQPSQPSQLSQDAGLMSSKRYRHLPGHYAALERADEGSDTENDEGTEPDENVEEDDEEVKEVDQEAEGLSRSPGRRKTRASPAKKAASRRRERDTEENTEEEGEEEEGAEKIKEVADRTRARRRRKQHAPFDKEAAPQRKKRSSADDVDVKEDAEEELEEEDCDADDKDDDAEAGIDISKFVFCVPVDESADETRTPPKYDSHKDIDVLLENPLEDSLARAGAGEVYAAHSVVNSILSRVQGVDRGADAAIEFVLEELSERLRRRAASAFYHKTTKPLTHRLMNEILVMMMIAGAFGTTENALYEARKKGWAWYGDYPYPRETDFDAFVSALQESTERSKVGGVGYVKSYTGSAFLEEVVESFLSLGASFIRALPKDGFLRYVVCGLDDYQITATGWGFRRLGASARWIALKASPLGFPLYVFFSLLLRIPLGCVAALKDPFRDPGETVMSAVVELMTKLAQRAETHPSMFLVHGDREFRKVMRELRRRGFVTVQTLSEGKKANTMTPFGTNSIGTSVRAVDAKGSCGLQACIVTEQTSNATQAVGAFVQYSRKNNERTAIVASSERNLVRYRSCFVLRTKASSGRADVDPTASSLPAHVPPEVENYVEEFHKQLFDMPCRVLCEEPGGFVWGHARLSLMSSTRVMGSVQSWRAQRERHLLRCGTLDEFYWVGFPAEEMDEEETGGDDACMEFDSDRGVVRMSRELLHSMQRHSSFLNKLSHAPEKDPAPLLPVQDAIRRGAALESIGPAAVNAALEFLSVDMKALPPGLQARATALKGAFELWSSCLRYLPKRALWNVVGKRLGEEKRLEALMAALDALDVVVPKRAVNQDDEAYAALLRAAVSGELDASQDVTYARSHLDSLSQRTAPTDAMRVGLEREGPVIENLRKILARRGLHGCVIGVTPSPGLLQSSVEPLAATTPDGVVWCAYKHKNGDIVVNEPQGQQEASSSETYAAPSDYSMRGSGNGEDHDEAGNVHDNDDCASLVGELGTSDLGQDEVVRAKALLEIKTVQSESERKARDVFTDEKLPPITVGYDIGSAGLDQLREVTLAQSGWSLQLLHHAAVGDAHTMLCLTSADTGTVIGFVNVNFDEEVLRAHLKWVRAHMLWLDALLDVDDAGEILDRQWLGKPRPEQLRGWLATLQLSRALHRHAPVLGAADTLKPVLHDAHNHLKPTADTAKQQAKGFLRPLTGLFPERQLLVEVLGLLAVTSTRLLRGYELFERAMDTLEEGEDERDALRELRLLGYTGLQAQLQASGSTKTMFLGMLSARAARIRRAQACGEDPDLAEALDAHADGTVADEVTRAIRAHALLVGEGGGLACLNRRDGAEQMLAALSRMRGTSKRQLFMDDPRFRALRLTGAAALEHVPLPFPDNAKYSCVLDCNASDGAEVQATTYCSTCMVPLCIVPRPYFGGRSAFFVWHQREELPRYPFDLRSVAPIVSVDHVLSNSARKSRKPASAEMGAASLGSTRRQLDFSGTSNSASASRSAPSRQRRNYN